MRYHIQGFVLITLLAAAIWGTAQLAGPSLSGSVNAVGTEDEQPEDVVVLATDNQGTVTEDSPLTSEEITSLQFALTLLGYDTRGIDGVWGQNSQTAAELARLDFGLERDSPDRVLFETIQQMAADARATQEIETDATEDDASG